MKRTLLLLVIVPLFNFLSSCTSREEIASKFRNLDNIKLGVQEHVDVPVTSISGEGSVNILYIYDVKHNGREYTVFTSASNDIFVIENK